MLSPYLFYDSNCEAAFKFYEKTLGGKIEMLLRNEDGPPEMGSPPERKHKVMHARMSIGTQVLMASDAPPDHFHKPQGFSVSLTVGDPAEAEHKFKASSSSEFTGQLCFDVSRRTVGDPRGDFETP